MALDEYGNVKMQLVCSHCQLEKMDMPVSPDFHLMSAGMQFDVIENFLKKNSVGWKVTGDAGERAIICPLCVPRNEAVSREAVSLCEFTAAPKCLKCESREIKLKFCHGCMSSREEHLHLSCTRCGYAWASKTSIAKLGRKA